MFAQFSGKILSKNPPELVLEVGNTAYEIFMPMPSFYAIEKKDSATIYIHLNVKEDSHTLYGFFSLNEKLMFRELIRVSGVGPKVALAILSYLSIDNLISCIVDEDADILAKTPGIGKKTAQKLIIEIKNRIEKLNFSTTKTIKNSNIKGARSALNALGFNSKEIEKMLATINDKDYSTEQIIRLALKNK